MSGLARADVLRFIMVDGPYRLVFHRQSDDRVPILCADEEKRLVYGLAMEPDEIDAHGEYTTREVIEKAAHGYMASRMVGIQHTDEAPADVVQSYIAPQDLTIGGQPVTEGSWVVVIHVCDDALWGEVKAGKFGGISIGGWARRSE